MASLFDVEDFLVREGICLSGPLVRHEGDSAALYAFIETKRNAEGRQSPSNIHLRKLSEDLFKMDINIKFILVDVSGVDFEAGLRATLLHAFPNAVRNVFLSLDSDGGIVWIVPKGSEIRNVINEIEKRSKIYLENANIIFSNIKITVDENLPSRTAILSELRIAAPISCDLLMERFTKKGFSKPPLDYLSRHLDALRKAGHVVRARNGQFCLSASALKALGTIKRRRSPDITRLLDLARRGAVD